MNLSHVPQATGGWTAHQFIEGVIKEGAPMTFQVFFSGDTDAGHFFSP